jgi:hypothetical protein
MSDLLISAFAKMSAFARRHNSQQQLASSVERSFCRCFDLFVVCYPANPRE